MLQEVQGTQIQATRNSFRATTKGSEAAADVSVLCADGKLCEAACKTVGPPITCRIAQKAGLFENRLCW